SPGSPCCTITMSCASGADCSAVSRPCIDPCQSFGMMTITLPCRCAGMPESADCSSCSCIPDCADDSPSSPSLIADVPADESSPYWADSGSRGDCGEFPGVCSAVDAAGSCPWVVSGISAWYCSDCSSLIAALSPDCDAWSPSV